MRKLLQIAICSMLAGCQARYMTSEVPERLTSETGPGWGQVTKPIRELRVPEVKRKSQEAELVEKLLSLGWSVQEAKPKYVIAEKLMTPEEAAVIFASDLPGEPQRLKLELHLIRWKNGKWSIEGIVAEEPRGQRPVAVLSGLKAEKVADLVQEQLDRAERRENPPQNKAVKF